MNRQDRLAIMAAIIYASRTVTLKAGGGVAGGWEKSPGEVAAEIDDDVWQVILRSQKKTGQSMTHGHPVGCECRDCVDARIEAAG